MEAEEKEKEISNHTKNKYKAHKAKTKNISLHNSDKTVILRTIFWLTGLVLQ
jgi:hypothetical protein